MLVEIKIVNRPRTKLKTNHLKETKRFCVLKCDMCNIKFERDYNKRLENAKRHFCGHKCSSDFSQKTNYPELEQKHKQEKRMKKLKENNLKNYGVEHNWQRPEIALKIKNTLIEKYGVDNPLKNKEIQERVRETVQEKYGVNHVFQAESVKNSIKETCLERYGVEYSAQADVVKTKIVDTLMKNHGVNAGWKTEACQISSHTSEARVKAKETTIERHGVDCGFKMKKCRDNLMNVLTDPEKSKIRSQKCSETMKENGTYHGSKVENQIYDVLCEIFGVDDVVRQRPINGWIIDFYVTSIQLYLQVDGIYWHGLDRSIEEIKKFKNKRDVTIFQAFQRDKQQDVWFPENNLKLVRITDKEIKSLSNVLALQEHLKKLLLN